MRPSPSDRGRTCHNDGVCSIVSYSNWQPTRINTAQLCGRAMNDLLPGDVSRVNSTRGPDPKGDDPNSLHRCKRPMKLRGRCGVPLATTCAFGQLSPERL